MFKNAYINISINFKHSITNSIAHCYIFRSCIIYFS